MMARYIDVDELFKTARDGYHSDFGRSMADLTSLQEVVEDTPTADVVEVKHGEWVESQYVSKKLGIPVKNEFIFACSVCGHEAIGKSKYCPNCGADMRERRMDDD